jgi:hypothetical protein
MDPTLMDPRDLFQDPVQKIGCLFLLRINDWFHVWYHKVRFGFFSA